MGGRRTRLSDSLPLDVATRWCCRPVDDLEDDLTQSGSSSRVSRELPGDSYAVSSPHSKPEASLTREQGVPSKNQNQFPLQEMLQTSLLEGSKALSCCVCSALN